jgi:hypothetical protein
VLTLALVFMGGVATGAVLMRLREHQLHVPSSASARVTSTVEEWKRQLDLSDDQTRQIVSILDDFSQYYDNVLADGNSRIMQVLKPEQQRRFEDMLRQRRH